VVVCAHLRDARLGWRGLPITHGAADPAGGIGVDLYQNEGEIGPSGGQPQPLALASDADSHHTCQDGSGSSGCGGNSGPGACWSS
jgi:hypothetical protein